MVFVRPTQLRMACHASRRFWGFRLRCGANVAKSAVVHDKSSRSDAPTVCLGELRRRDRQNRPDAKIILLLYGYTTVRPPISVPCNLAKAAPEAPGRGGWKGTAKFPQTAPIYPPSLTYTGPRIPLQVPAFVPARLRHITRNCAPPHASNTLGFRPYARYEHRSGRLLLRRRTALLFLR